MNQYFQSTQYSFGREGGGPKKEYSVYAFENVDNYGRPLRWIQGNTRKTQGKTESEMIGSGVMQKIMQWSSQSPHVTQKRLPWYGHEMRREDKKVAMEIATMKVGGKRPPRKAQNEEDGQSAMRYERTPTRTKARTEPRSMEKGCRGNRPRTGIRPAEVSKGE